MMVIEPVPPGATEPTAHSDDRSPLIVQPVTGRGASPVGRVSVTTTSVAVDGPSLR